MAELRDTKMSTIFIHDLRLETRIGVYDWERHLPQTLRLDLELEVPSDAAFFSDDFSQALDYAAVVQRVRSFAGNHGCGLLERFAQRIADIALSEFHAPWVRVRVAKLGALAGVKEIGVTIERRRE